MKIKKMLFYSVIVLFCICLINHVVQANDSVKLKSEKSSPIIARNVKYAPYRSGGIDVTLFNEEYKKQYTLINDVLKLFNYGTNFDPYYHKPYNLARVFNKLVSIPNLIQLLTENKGISDVQSMVADEKTIVTNKQKMLEIFPLSLEKTQNKDDTLKLDVSLNDFLKTNVKESVALNDYTYIKYNEFEETGSAGLGDFGRCSIKPTGKGIRTDVGYIYPYRTTSQNFGRDGIKRAVQYLDVTFYCAEIKLGFLNYKTIIVSQSNKNLIQRPDIKNKIEKLGNVKGAVLVGISLYTGNLEGYEGNYTKNLTYDDCLKHFNEKLGTFKNEYKTPIPITYSTNDVLNIKVWEDKDTYLFLAFLIRAQGYGDDEYAIFIFDKSAVDIGTAARNYFDKLQKDRLEQKRKQRNNRLLGE